MVTNNINKLAEELEKQELEALNGIATPQLYAQLLAVYLYQNDLCNAKYLWKRVPPSVKSANAEIGQIWTIGQQMWQRDFPSAYKALMVVTWSEHVADIMKAVQENVRSRAVDLITQAYSSISLETVAGMTGLASEQAVAASLERGWAVDSDRKM
ncbi:hypothetical protein CBL_03107 [Carabus blaptoides fortunei]